MATVSCTPRLESVGPSKPVAYPGDTVLEVLHALAVDYPKLSNYILDDRGQVRKHVAIFIGGSLQPRETVLNQAIGPEDEIFFMQALSGG